MRRPLLPPRTRLMRYDQIVFMYDPSLQPVILTKLAKWGRLTESDLDAMLRPEDRLRLRGDLLQDMAWDGLVTVETIGDEPVITITDKGRAWLEHHQRSA